MNNIKILIEKVSKGGVSEKTGKTFSYWIIGQLNSGKKLRIKDRWPFDLRKLESKKVECLLFATFISDINSINERDEKEIAHPIIKGRYLGEYDIPSKWMKCNGFRMISGYHAVKSVNGIFLIDPSDFKRNEVKVINGEEIIFKVASIVLKAWLPIIEEVDYQSTDEPELMLEIEPKDFIENFWKLTDLYCEKTYEDRWDRRQFFIDGLKDWTLEEMLLFDETHYYLTSLLRENFELVEIFGYYSDDRWHDFCMGTVVLGKMAFRDALINPKKFYDDVMRGVYGEEPRYIENELYGVGEQALEKVKGAPSSDLVDSVFDKAFDNTFEKIKELFNEEFLR